MSPLDRRNSITTFRRTFNNFIENLERLLSDEELLGRSLEASLHPIFKAIGILERNGALSPIGKRLKEKYEVTQEIDYSILRMQIAYYFQERDFKPLSLDILNFIFNNTEADKQEIANFLKEKGYFLGNNPLQSIGYFMPYLEKIGYLEEQDGRYYIPDNVKNSVSKLLRSSIYKFNEKYYYDKYSIYYKSDKILDKILFFRYGIENE